MLTRVILSVSIPINMEDEGVDTTVIESLQHQLGRMADFPPLLTSSVDVPRIKSQAMRHTDETTLFEKYVDPY